MCDMAKEPRLSQRQEQAVLDTLKDVSNKSGIPSTTLIAAAIKGLDKAWKEEGRLTFPFLVVSEADYLDLKNKLKKYSK